MSGDPRTDTGARVRRSWRRRVLVLTAAVGGLMLLTAVLYVASAHTLPGNSDDASVILEGQALASGNVTLAHWTLGLDSFWLVDALLNAVVVGIAGSHPQLMHLVPAALAASTIGLGAWIATRGHRGVAAFVAGGTVVVLLGLPTKAISLFLLLGPLHVGTTLWCLLALVALRRCRFGWGFAVATLLFAAALVSDLEAAAFGVLSAAGAGVLLMAQRRSWRAGLPAVTSAAASVLLALVGRLLADVVGTFKIGSLQPHASIGQTVVNIGHLVPYAAALEGIGGHPFTGPPGLAFQLAHAVGFMLCAAALVAAAVTITRWAVTGSRPRGAEWIAATTEPDLEGLWFVDVVSAAFVASCAAFCFLAVTSVGSFGRDLTSAVVFAVVLGGRVAGSLTERLRRASVTGAAGALALVVIAGYASAFAATLSDPLPAQPIVPLVDYLETHHLTHGVGDFWSSSIVTVQSSGAVVVRPVVANGKGEIGRYMHLSTSAWYQGSFQFLVYNMADKWGNVEMSSVVTSFGPPAEVADVGTYRVITWPYEIRIAGNGAFARPWAAAQHA